MTRTASENTATQQAGRAYGRLAGTRTPSGRSARTRAASEDPSAPHGRTRPAWLSGRSDGTRHHRPAGARTASEDTDGRRHGRPARRRPRSGRGAWARTASEGTAAQRAEGWDAEGQRGHGHSSSEIPWHERPARTRPLCGRSASAPTACQDGQPRSGRPSSARPRGHGRPAWTGPARTLPDSEHTAPKIRTTCEGHGLRTERAIATAPR